MPTERKVSKADTREYLSDKVAGVEESLKRIALISRIGSGTNMPIKEESVSREPKGHPPKSQ